MRNLIAFFKRFRVFLYFAFLQIIALSIYVRYLSFPKSQYLTTASSITAKVLETENDITKHFSLSKNNLALQKENIRLRKNLPQSLYRVDRNLLKINDTTFKQQYAYIPATVIHSTVTRRNNYFTLDVGWKQGIKRDMGVFSDKGVVGIVHNTSEHYCVVKSVLTKDINIDVMIEPIGLFGSLIPNLFLRIDFAIFVTASFCPMTDLFNSSSKLIRAILSSKLSFVRGIFVIVDTTS